MIRILGWALLAFLLLVSAGAAWIAWAYHQHPDLSPFDEYVLPAAPDSERRPGQQVTVQFLGIATLLFSDGETAILTDGWFTRVSTADLLLGRPVSPDLAAIEAGLERAGIANVAVVIPVHSHYDHAQDAPEVARRTGALLLGSETTAWIGRGGGLAEEQIAIAEPGAPMRFGAFTVTLVESEHVPLPFAGTVELPLELDAPLVPPVPAMDYPMGGAWSILIEHPLGSALVQGSAGFVPGALDRHGADVVFLGTGALASQEPDYVRGYLEETVEAVGAKRIIPIHYDDLTIPAGDAPVASPWLIEDTPGAFDLLLAWARAAPDRSFRLLPYWKPVVLFD